MQSLRILEMVTYRDCLLHDVDLHMSALEAFIQFLIEKRLFAYLLRLRLFFCMFVIPGLDLFVACFLFVGVVVLM